MKTVFNRNSTQPDGLGGSRALINPWDVLKPVPGFPQTSVSTFSAKIIQRFATFVSLLLCDIDVALSSIYLPVKAFRCILFPAESILLHPYFQLKNISWRAVGFMQKNSSRTVITTTGTAGIKYAFISFPYVLNSP